MITGILAFFQAIPALMGGLNHFTDTFYNAKVALVTARVGGDVSVAKALVAGVNVEGQTRVEWLKTVGQSPFLMFLIGGFALPWMIHEWKVIIWDNMLGWGVTLPIRGSVGDWGGLIITSIFGSATVLGAGQMYFNRKERS